MRSSIEPVSGPHAVVCASRIASSSDAPDAVAVPVRPWNSTDTLHSARWLERVDQSRNATNPAMSNRVTVLVRAVIREEPPEVVRCSAGVAVGAARCDKEEVRMECADVAQRLWEYLDGELAAKEAAAVDRHLAGCRHCRPHYYCDHAFLLLLVRSLSRPCPVPIRLRAAVLARLYGR